MPKHKIEFVGGRADGSTTELDEIPREITLGDPPDQPKREPWEAPPAPTDELPSVSYGSGVLTPASDEDTERQRKRWGGSYFIKGGETALILLAIAGTLSTLEYVWTPIDVDIP